jgi:hypothetical protein
MPTSFNEQLAKVSGKIHVVNFANDYARFRDGLLYYWNRAETLRNGATAIWEAGGPRTNDVAAMLMGMAIELLLKGIRRALDLPPSKSHRLDHLCDDVGIIVDENDRMLLRVLSEYVIWQSRYTVPNSTEHLAAAEEIFAQQRRKSGSLDTLFISERSSSADNCERLWDLFAEHYHRAREARIESVELRYD